MESLIDKAMNQIDEVTKYMNEQDTMDETMILDELDAKEMNEEWSEKEVI